MKPAIKTGILVGNGAAINVELGWIPTCVQLFNSSDGDIITTAFLQWVVPFTSGGTVEIIKGSTIRGNTSRATAQVADVLLYSGSFAAGDAAGFLVLQEGSLVGTFAGETVVVQNAASGVLGTDDATVTANVVHNVAVAAAATPVVAGTSAISRYEGAAATNAQGFTIGSVIAEEAKVLRFIAFREDT
jgi:hypothetical protein